MKLPKSTDGKKRILALSYGKDSLSCLGALEELGWPLDRIVHAEVWATDTIPADAPPMVDFKAEADAIIIKRYGIEVEHLRAATTYEQCFYSVFQKGKRAGTIYGWPYLRGPWCNSKLKLSVMNKTIRNAIWYIGIAADEPERMKVLNSEKLSPLVAAGWDEARCRSWCEAHNLLSPIYTSSARGGCWFCHNQSVEQLRLLRKTYPEYWQMMMKWDEDSPVAFKASGCTVHDFDKRFLLEDEGFISPSDEIFRWSMLEQELNYRWF